METIVKDAHAAYGVNSHFWFRSKDGKSLFVLEQYEDNKALSQAIRRFTTARISFFRSMAPERGLEKISNDPAPIFTANCLGLNSMK